MIRPLIIGAAAISVCVLAALNANALLSNLRDVLRRSRKDQGSTENEQDRIRRALAPITMKFDEEKWRVTFGSLPDDFDREAFFRSLPKLDPPLSQSIIDERREARY